MQLPGEICVSPEGVSWNKESDEGDDGYMKKTVKRFIGKVLPDGHLSLPDEADFTDEGFVLKIAAPLSPALLLGIRQYSEQMEAAARSDRLKEHSERLWNEALSGVSMSDADINARSLQDGIFENRRKVLLFSTTSTNGCVQIMRRK